MSGAAGAAKAATNLLTSGEIEEYGEETGGNEAYSGTYYVLLSRK